MWKKNKKVGEIYQSEESVAEGMAEGVTNRIGFSFIFHVSLGWTPIISRDTIIQGKMRGVQNSMCSPFDSFEGNC